MLLIAIVDERVEAIDTFGNHIAAASAVTAVRAAKFDIFLAPETDTASPAIARANIDFRLIEKLHDPTLISIG